MESLVSFQTGRTRSPITALSGVDLRAMSSGPRWLGLHLEVGAANDWEGDDLMVNGHFLAMNTAAEPLQLQVRDEAHAAWTCYTRPPGSFWIRPEGQPFSLRHQGQSHWAAAIIDGRFLDSVMGAHYELVSGVNVVDPVLEHLFRALIEELLGPSPQAYVTQTLVKSFVLALGARRGRPGGELPAKTGLSAAQLESLLGWIGGRLDAHLTVGDMAAQVGLSAAHFSREFKRATGRTPWEHVVELRLQRACGLLQQGESACATAQQCGFFDQAHLARLFKQRFGLSPSAYARVPASSGTRAV